jgi:pSer/pThr/pTyr-binding forkhead associated (FHA) protein
MKTTQIQNEQRPQLLHVQTHTVIDLPTNVSAIHIGKPNERIPPDIDISNLPNADVVSRVHFKISVEEGRFYFIEDLGSANGTYLNRTFLTPQTRRQLKPTDKIDLGKDNNVTFVFSLGK